VLLCLHASLHTHTLALAHARTHTPERSRCAHSISSLALAHARTHTPERSRCAHSISSLTCCPGGPNFRGTDQSIPSAAWGVLAVCCASSSSISGAGASGHQAHQIILGLVVEWSSLVEVMLPVGTTACNLLQIAGLSM
jgi:hypothetical protein